MALSSILKSTCPHCGKVAVEKSRIDFGGNDRLIALECGHLVREKSMVGDTYSIVSSDGKTLMPFQVEGVKFAEQANGNCLIGDEQGLGKTVQVAALIKLHREELLPAIVAGKTSTKQQWHWEFRRWCGIHGYLCQVIHTGKEKALPGFDIYIVTYDLLKVEGMFDLVDVKTLVLDECQAIKNHLSGRAKAVQKLVKDKNIEHTIALSGTPIKNNAGEYFTVLNLLKRQRFPTYQGFLDGYLDYYWSGYGNKVGGLRNPEKFFKDTKDFIIRRTKDEVMPDLPKLSRRFFHVELDKRFNKAYAAGMKELEELYYSEDGMDMTNLLAIYTKLRYITGVSKVDACQEFVEEFLESSERKITVFCHHHDAANILLANLNKYLADHEMPLALHLHSGLSGDARTELIKEFREGNKRLLIASTLAAGEGINLQFCSDAVMLERQWNPPNEEQAEARFHRYGQDNPVTITYMIASETIDEFFTELVEQKRSIIHSTLDNKQTAWDQNSLMKELANILVTKGKKKWSI